MEKKRRKDMEEERPVLHQRRTEEKDPSGSASFHQWGKQTPQSESSAQAQMHQSPQSERSVWPGAQMRKQMLNYGYVCPIHGTRLGADSFHPANMIQTQQDDNIPAPFMIEDTGFPEEILEPGMKLLEEWVVPLTRVEDIYEKFVKFCLGELRSSPWSELGVLQPETKITKNLLAKINKKGFLTINSQPAVNGEKSNPPYVGWVGPPGYVYKKSHVEFFCTKKKLFHLVDIFKVVPAFTYVAMNQKGDWVSNRGRTNENVVTWGAFGREVMELSVTDTPRFTVWKNKAFERWSRGWADFYPEGSSSRKLLQEVKETYFLVSVVDNDYSRGDLLDCISSIS